MLRNKNGLPLLTKSVLEEMKRGCNSANCPPPETSTLYPIARSKSDAPTLSNPSR